jgi:hypothetical protein
VLDEPVVGRIEDQRRVGRGARIDRHVDTVRSSDEQEMT